VRGEPRAVAEWSLEAATTSAAATRALGAALAGCCSAGDLVCLAGGLGSGKTTLAQGFASGLGVRGPVTSPTFTLVREYPVPEEPRGVALLLHADLYRLESLAEVADLGLPELVEDAAVALVEWGDAATPVLGESVLVVALEHPGEGPPGTGTEERRRVRLTGRGPSWAGRRAAVAAALATFAPEEERRPA